MASYLKIEGTQNPCMCLLCWYMQMRVVQMRLPPLFVLAVCNGARRMRAVALELPCIFLQDFWGQHQGTETAATCC